MPDPAAVRSAAEDWFIAHGLPYFVDARRSDVRRRLSRSRIVLVTLTAALVAAAVGFGFIALLDDRSIVVAAASTTFLVVWAAYAARALDAWPIVRWALRRTFGSLGLLFPLATRAMPMLLLFVTFLFINTEVWQVASALDGGVLWGAVLTFGLVAVGFLTARLGEELDQFDDSVSADDLAELCVGTPLEPAAVEVAQHIGDTAEQAQVSGLQKANLVLMLLVVQAVQVLLLAVAMFAFFLVFGRVAIDDAVIESWIGQPPTYPPGPRLVSVELTQVSTFLAGFSGLYFTVYAVTDQHYREQFFGAVTRELGRVVSARVVYRALG